MLAHGLDADGGGQVGLARCPVHRQGRRSRGVDEVTLVESFDQCAINGTGREVEPEQVTMDGEIVRPSSAGLGTNLPFGGLGLQQFGRHPVSGLHGRRIRQQFANGWPCRAA